MTRAPGRLDVMGGIADYSGSLVLQVNAKLLIIFMLNILLKYINKPLET